MYQAKKVVGSSTYQLSEIDKKVVKAFVMEREADGQLLLGRGESPLTHDNG